MTTRLAPQTYVAVTMTALLGVSAWCASALASNDVQAPSPELVAQTSATLHDILDQEASSSRLRTLDSSDIVTLPALAEAAVKAKKSERDEGDATVETLLRNTEIPDIATRLPGVSATDLPRLRRHMFRTDI